MERRNCRSSAAERSGEDQDNHNNDNDGSTARVNKPRVVIVGLGPGDSTLLTFDAQRHINATSVKFARTRRHPACDDLPADVTYFDDVYESADHIDDVYAHIANTVAAAAALQGSVLYIVPGSPLVAEHTVELLRANPAVTCDIRPALSYLDVAWAALGIDPLAAGVRLVDGHTFAVDAAGERGPLLVAQTDRRQVLSDMKLALGDADLDALAPVTVLHHLGLEDQQVFEISWAELDRHFEPDHLTSIWVPELAAPVGNELIRFNDVIRRLRRECPWDKAQTHQTLTRYVLEEAYEMVEAIARLDVDDPTTDDGFIDELGDVLLQVVLHSAIAEQDGRFTLADVAEHATEKMIRRHPHVFAGASANTVDQVARNWQQIKAAERGESGAATRALDGVNTAVPSLMHAHAVQRAAAKVGFDWPDVMGAYAKVTEELAEVQAASTDVDRRDEIGDLLFAVVNAARHLGVEPESALRAATAKFAGRFEAVEDSASARGIPMLGSSIETLDKLWDEVKAQATRSEPS